MRKMKKLFCLFLCLCLTVLPMVSCKEPVQSPVTPDPLPIVTAPETYTYSDSVLSLSANWNPHTCKTADDAYPLDFLTTGLYGFFYNDNYFYTAEGLDAYEGYAIVPEMAAELPIDVTATVRANAAYGIPADATSGYAYLIKLNQNAKWENGEAINADTYVESMKRLLDPQLQNARAAEYIDGALAIANAGSYFYQGGVLYLANSAGLALADMVKGEDGVYRNPETGNKMVIAITRSLACFNGKNSLADYVNAYGSYFSLTYWEQLVALAGETGVVELTDETYPMILDLITTNPMWGEDETYMPNYFLEAKYFEENYGFANVGICKTGEYEIVIVLEKAISEFDLISCLTENWIVYLPYYDASPADYNTSVETTVSYGPYKLTDYQKKKEMTFEKNGNWFGYTDGKHKFKDPVDGQIYDMYQTTKIHCRVVSEASSRKYMFLKGQLMTYGLQSEDFAQYRSSDYAYANPSSTVYFFMLNGYVDAIREREAEVRFDTDRYDLETITLESFRRAFSLVFDRDDFTANVSPSRTGALGLIGEAYIYDTATGAAYRDTPQAKKVLCEFYGVDYNAAPFNGDLDAAVASITGYDHALSKELFTQAYHEAIEAGYITDADGDGRSDQVIRIEYGSYGNSVVTLKVQNYLNEKLAEVLVGTPFEGRIQLEAQYSDFWGIFWEYFDLMLAGWPGSEADPYALTDHFTNPEKQYDANWFDSSSVSFTLSVNLAKPGETANVQEVTMTLKQWSDALNGATVTVNGVDYNFGEGMAEVDTRLDILAKIESTVLSTYSYVPFLQDGSFTLLSQQVSYVVKDYSAIMGRGGIAYLRYNYGDSAWEAYVASQPNGVLTY